ncbi:MAG TPA: hypothetical protein VLH09_14475 [Bryobacteraceae bacterium]|nr:hypothetical protein [Bryobacteraceae bacterium]
MATQASSFDRFQSGAGWGEPAAETGRKRKAGPCALRPVPNEEIYFFRKAINNTGVVRQSDPQSRARCWRWIATTAAGTLLLAGLLWPSLYGMVAGYQIEALKVRQQRLIAERSELELQEARLLSPEKLEELARAQDFVDPAPAQVVHLGPQPDGSLAALNTRPK